MTIVIVIVIGMAMVAMCGRFARLAGISAQQAGNHARAAAASSRRDAEGAAADPALVEIDRGTVAPLRLVHPEEAREQLLDAAVRRHPAGRRR